MDKRTAGIILICTGALTKALGSIAAGLAAESYTSWSVGGSKFSEALNRVYDSTDPAAFSCFVLGAIYLIVAESSSIKQLIQKH